MVPGCMASAISMEDSEVEVTVRVIGTEEIVPKVAVMVVAPTVRAIARPVLIPTVATDVLDELQVTSLLISCVVVSEYVPVALSCSATPTGRPRLAGVTAMPVRAALDTVRLANPDTPPEVAMIDMGPPAVSPVARPVLRSTVATEGLDELHIT